MENNDEIKIKFFNEHYLEIEKVVEARRYKWQMKGFLMMEFEDVKFQILNHVFTKLHLYDEKQPLANWVSTITTNQIHNCLRNILYNHSRPCLRCACQRPENSCEIYNDDLPQCPLYSKWLETKKVANDLKLPVPICNHEVEVFNIPGSEPDYKKAEQKFHEEMKKVLKCHEWVIYEMLYIFHLSDSEIAKKMKWISSEKHRKPGYGNLMRLKKIFIEKARKIKEEIDLF